MGRRPWVEWSRFGPTIQRIHAEGGSLAQIDEAIIAMGYSGSLTTLANYMNRVLGLYFREPRDRTPRRGTKEYQRSSSVRHQVNNDPDYVPAPPPQYRSLTAQLMGDPPVGRTPWA